MTIETHPSRSAIGMLVDWAKGRNLEVKQTRRGHQFVVGVYQQPSQTPLVERWSADDWERAAFFVVNALMYLGAGPEGDR